MSGASNLTQMQVLGVGSDTNVAEGYPRFALTPTQQQIVDSFPALIREASEVPFPLLEARAHSAFFGALGQDAAPIGAGKILSFYSSTVAIDVVCSALARRGTTVGVIHPTLDCIPALLRARGLSIVPLSERTLAARNPLDGYDGLDAIFIASPNNPTGTVLAASQLRRIALGCAERSIVLVIDQCFRAFDPRAQFDSYAILEESGVEYVVAEDTGKLWPIAGLKLGFLAYGDTTLPLAEVASDILLTAPAFTSIMVERFSLDMAAGGMEELHAHIAANRERLQAVLAGCERAVVVDPSSRASVARVKLPPGLSSTRVWGRLLRHGVHAVPCRPFYWARPATGERYIRIALAREPDVVQRAATALRLCVEETV
jgi:aspartate/methionine/tyrosine aminotransferase